MTLIFTDSKTTFNKLMLNWKDNAQPHKGL